ncbi:MAG: MFS transporter [Chitinophagaceae bacterium]
MLAQASAQKKRIATILTFIAIPLSGFVTDIYLPSFPAMAKDLGVHQSSIQLTLTCFFMSYGLSQLLVGSLLDSIGRFRPAMFSLGVLVVTSLLIGLTHSVTLICALRIIQGIAVAFIIVAKRAFFVDLYTGEERKHYLGYFTIIWSCGPIIAPFLGGYLQQYFNWQSNFYFLAAYALIILVLELSLSGETLAEKKPFHIEKIKKDYAMMLGNKNFLLGIILLGLSYSVVMVFNIAGPFIIANSFHFNSVVIGLCTLILGIAWMTGGIINRKTLAIDFNRKVKFAGSLQFTLIVALLLIGFMYQQLWSYMILAFVIHCCCGFLFTVYFTHSLLYFPQNAGMTGGLMGGMIYGITSLTSFIISHTGRILTQQDMLWRYLVMSVILVLVLWYAVRLDKQAQHSSGTLVRG